MKFIALALVCLAFSGCACGHIVFTQRCTVTEKAPYNQPCCEITFGVEESF